MDVHARAARAVLRFAAAGWTAASLWGCGPTPIDVDRLSYVTPTATTARVVSQTELSLIHHQIQYELNLKAAEAERPADSRGMLPAYTRWLNGQVRAMPRTASSTE